MARRKKRGGKSRAPREGLDERLERIAELVQHGRLAPARRELEAILDRDPGCVPALHRLGTIECRFGDAARGLRLLEQAVERTPTDAGLWNDLGIARAQGGDAAAAEVAYRRVLELAPNHASAMVNLSSLLRRDGRWDEAAELAERATRANARDPLALNALGNVRKQQGRFEEAADAYSRARRLSPSSYEFAYNLGYAWLQLGRADDAERVYRDALALRPDFADAHQNLAAALRKQGKRREAVEAWRRALELDPSRLELYESIGTSLYALGEIEAAADAYRTWLRLDPSSEVARHMLAALTGAETPDRASDEYVQFLFDQFAETFDDNLEQLGYRAPEWVEEAFVAARHELGRSDSATILDAGCGTGLCGERVRGHAQRLVGVDLSGGMVERARARGIYDALEVAELTRYLETTEERFDAILSSDTVNYFGALEALFAAAARTLEPSGLFVFTVENPPGPQEEPYRLRPHGRYSHRGDYVDSALRSASLVPVAAKEVTLRQESGTPVQGTIITARR